ncbi:MAG: monovalent cation/H(+) antiporter subunit G [Tenuifilaceae bacterium]|jgi:multicomponent Na+:H+ antiporter subunit G|nr:monovalent cation/H(+) antiporter subunit G [Tenuifilaceae bacterium]
MDYFQELISSILISAGGLFIVIAAIGILKLPDFYIRMSAITKAGTMGVGLIAIGIAIYFNDTKIAIKSFVVVSFMILTAPVAAHIIARAAYRQGVPFWGNNLVDELNEASQKLKDLEKAIAENPNAVQERIDLVECYTALPHIQGGNFKKAVLVATDLKEIDRAAGHYATGLVYARDKDYFLAEEEFKLAVQESNDTMYKYQLASFYCDRKQYKQAFHIYDEIISHTQSEPRALLEFGKTAVIARLQLAKAEKYLTQLVHTESSQINIDIGEACYFLGLVLRKGKKYSQAKVYFQRVLEFDSPYRSSAQRFLKGK